MNMLITVYNDIERDARVLRQIDAFQPFLHIDILCCDKTNMFSGSPTVKSLPIVEGKSLSEVSYWDYLKACKQINLKKYDYIYCNDYYSCLPVVWYSKKKCSNKIIYDAHELIVDCKKVRERFFRCMERKAVYAADTVICASDQRKRIMMEYYKLEKAPITIRNISKLSITDVIYTNEEKSFFADSRCKIVYAGVLKQGRKLELLCKAIKELENDFILMIVGYGEHEEHLKDSCKDENIGNVIFTGGKKNSQLGAYICKADIGYLYYPCTDLNNKYCAPNKIYEYSSLELPIISNNNPTMEKELLEYGIGEIFNDEADDDRTIKNIIGAIIKIATNIDEYKQRAKMYSDCYSWELEKKQLQAVLGRGDVSYGANT